jgi:hypothetical protein
LAGVQSLAISCGLIEEEQAKNLRGISNLYLYGCDIEDHALQHLSGVKRLDLTCNQRITTIGISYLQGVQMIDLSLCQVTDETLVHLSGVPHLSLVNAFITDDGLSHLRGVKSIDLRGCPNVTDRGLMYIKGVEKIFLAHNSITDQGLYFIRGVKTISMIACDQVTDRGLVHLMGSVTKFYIKCPSVTLAGRSQLGDKQEEFDFWEHFNLPWTSDFSDLLAF